MAASNRAMQVKSGKTMAKALASPRKSGAKREGTRVGALVDWRGAGKEKGKFSRNRLRDGN